MTESARSGDSSASALLLQIEAAAELPTEAERRRALRSLKRAVAADSLAGLRPASDLWLTMGAQIAWVYAVQAFVMDRDDRLLGALLTHPRALPMPVELLPMVQMLFSASIGRRAVAKRGPKPKAGNETLRDLFMQRAALRLIRVVYARHYANELEKQRACIEAGRAYTGGLPSEQAAEGVADELGITYGQVRRSLGKCPEILPGLAQFGRAVKFRDSDESDEMTNGV